MRQRRKRLTQSSLYWAVWVILLREKWRNVILVWFKPWRFAFAWLYFSREGYFLEGDKLIAVDFVEPKDLGHFAHLAANSGWIYEESQPVAKLQGYEFERGLFYTSFRIVGEGNNPMPKLVVSDSVNKLRNRFEGMISQARQLQADRRITDEATHQLAVERAKERLRSQQDGS